MKTIAHGKVRTIRADATTTDAPDPKRFEGAAKIATAYSRTHVNPCNPFRRRNKPTK